MLTAKISEIFESVQGEGLYVGEQQLFLRFFGCPVACGPCDTPLEAFREYTVGELRDEVRKFSGYHSISLTGGEPLMQADFIRDFLGGLAPARPKIYLETGGIHIEELKKIIDVVDIVAMDFKLPSWSGLRPFWREHEEFLKIAAEKEVFVKIVAGNAATEEEMASAAGIVKKVSARIPVVLQPDWRDFSPVLLDKMARWKELLLARGVNCVKILPQAHKIAGIK